MAIFYKKFTIIIFKDAVNNIVLINFYINLINHFFNLINLYYSYISFNNYHLHIISKF